MKILNLEFEFRRLRACSSNRGASVFSMSSVVNSVPSCLGVLVVEVSHVI